MYFEYCKYFELLTKDNIEDLLNNFLKKHIYIFSGLGADKRMFQNMDLSKFETYHIEWTIPKLNMTIEEYSKEMSKIIIQDDSILIGLSFGGIIAQEVAKIKNHEKLIIISSIKNRSELPFYFKTLNFLGINKFIPTSLLTNSNFFTNWFFGAKSNVEKVLLKDILKNTNAIFLKWAIDKILKWNENNSLKRIIHIHGNKDRILPTFCIKDINYVVENGGHFMVLNKAKEIESILYKEICN